MKYILIVLFVLLGFAANAQLPSNTFYSRWFTGNTRSEWIKLDSPLVNPVMDTFYARYAGTQIVRMQGGDTAFWFYAGNRIWKRLGNFDSTSLSNRINLKLNITDTVGKWLDQATRLVDTIYRVNDSTVGYTIKGNPYTFQIIGGASGGGGGSGTVTSVGLSLPSAFNVTPSSITTSGTFAVTGAGTTSQYIRGNGTLATTDTGMIPNFYLKVRGLFSATSPITYNSTTGIFGITNANTSGTKGAATFSSGSFSDNGSGTISLVDVVTAGSCINCDITFDAKGRATSFASGTPPQFVNAPGAGDTLSRSDTLKRLNPGYGILHTVNDNNITQSVDTGTSGLATKYDLSLVNNGLSRSADSTQWGQAVSASGNPAALTHNTEIPLNSFNAVFTGTGGLGIGTSTVGNRKLNIAATSATQGINMTTVDGTGINVVSSGTGNAIFGQTGGTGTAITGSNAGTSGYGVSAVSSDNNAIPFKANNFSTLTNSATPVVAEFVRNVTGVPADGAGLTVMFRGQTTTTTDVEMGQIRSYLSTALHGSRSSAFEFHLVNNAVSARKALLAASGQWTWDGYPALTQQTDTTNIKPIGYNTTTGLIQPMANWSGGGSVDTVFSTYVAYVDTLGNDATGVLNNPAKPFATLNGALDALPSFGGKIEIGVGEFLVPDTGKIKSNVWFAGSGMPHYNDTITVVGVLNNTSTTITKMLGGTRLHGFFSIPYNRNNVDMSNLGVDNGSEWIDANNGGVALDCIGYAQRYGPGLNSADGFHLLQTSANPRTGIDVWNVSVLVKSPTDLVHGFIFENMINPNVDNIYSCYGFAGIVIKTMYGVFTNLHAMGHSDAGIYLKSNDYSYCFGVTVTGFEIKSVGSYDGGGMHINANDAGSPGLYYCDIANGTCIYTKYGIKSVGSVIDNININNVICAHAQGDGFSANPLYYSTLSNCTARSNGGDGFHLVAGGSGKGPFIANCISASNTGDGFDISGSLRMDLDNVTTENNTGYGINSSNSNLFVGIHSETTNGAGAINGTYNTKLIVNNGGTGNIAFTPYAILAGGTTTTGALQQVSGLGTSGQVLTSNGAGALPTWETTATSITTLNTLTAATQTFATGTSGTDFNISSVTSTHTFNIPSASTSNRGLVTTTSQTFGGGKTFNDGATVTFPTSGSATSLVVSGDRSLAGAPGISGIGLQLASFTYTNSSGAGTETQGQNLHLVGTPTLTSSNAISYTGDVSTIRFVGAPIAAGSTTISHPWNIYANDNSFIEGVAFGLNEQATNATLGDAAFNVYTGSGGETFTLPALATWPGKIYYIKNAGGGNLTVSRAGSDNLYTTTSVTTITVAAGASATILAGSAFWYVM